MEWICNWEKCSKIRKHVSNLKMLSLIHFISVFKNHKCNYLLSDCSWQTCVTLCYYFCSTSCTMHHANIPLGDDKPSLYYLHWWPQPETVADRHGCQMGVPPYKFIFYSFTNNLLKKKKSMSVHAISYAIYYYHPGNFFYKISCANSPGPLVDFEKKIK